MWEERFKIRGVVVKEISEDFVPVIGDSFSKLVHTTHNLDNNILDTFQAVLSRVNFPNIYNWSSAIFQMYSVRTKKLWNRKMTLNQYSSVHNVIII